MMFYFQSGQLGHSTNTIILKSNEHKSYAWVFSVICTGSGIKNYSSIVIFLQKKYNTGIKSYSSIVNNTVRK